MKDEEWDDVRIWYEKHPEKTMMIGRHNSSTSTFTTRPLHTMCSIPSVPVHLFQYILDSNPNAVTVQEPKFGATPLHLLCWTTNNRSSSHSHHQQSIPPTAAVGSTTVLSKIAILLEQMQPEDLLIRNTVSGSTVLHSACGSHADISILQALVRKYPPIVLAKTIGSDQHSTTAIHALWQSHIQSIPGHLYIARILDEGRATTTQRRRQRQRGRESSSVIKASSFKMTKEQEESTARIFNRFWNKVQFLATETYKLKLASNNNNDSNSNRNNDTNLDNSDTMTTGNVSSLSLNTTTNNNNNYVLHGLFEMKSPLNTFRVALKMHPELASYSDHEGNYPLHHAVLQRPFFHRIKDTATLIKVLVGAYPQAGTTRNANGHIPLHIAIRDRMAWQEGFSTLIGNTINNNNNNTTTTVDNSNEADDVLSIPDIATGLYPFLLCACMGGKVVVNNTFGMLRAKPDLVRG